MSNYETMILTHMAERGYLHHSQELARTYGAELNALTARGYIMLITYKRECALRWQITAGGREYLAREIEA